MKSLKQKDHVLRLVTAGSVDDGKSTLLGRLLFEAKAVFDDHLEAIERQRLATGELDLSLLADGLKSEREQGITIDVAYKYFATPKRKYILADSPGHVQYTRNMVTAASQAEVALILVDASQGLTEQSRRHAFIVSMLGLKHVVLLVNKLDLLDYQESVFKSIVDDFLGLEFWSDSIKIDAIPISALRGDNVAKLSDRTPWYQGSPLLVLLDALEIEAPLSSEPEISVQTVVRGPDGDRFALGTLSGGRLQIGDEIRLFPGQVSSRVAQLWVSGLSVQEAHAGQAVAINLADEVDVERGQILASPKATYAWQDRLEAQLVWFDDDALKHDQSFLLAIGHQLSRVQIISLGDRINLQTLQSEPMHGMQSNDIGSVSLQLAKRLLVKKFADNPRLGRFILIHPESNRTVAAGIITSNSFKQENGQYEQRVHWIKSGDFSQAKDQSGPRSTETNRSIYISDAWLAQNEVKNLATLIVDLVDQGWLIRIEDTMATRQLAPYLNKQGLAFFEAGAGI